MKKSLRIIGLIILGFIALLLVVMLCLGTKYHFEKSMVIKSSPDKIYPYISSMDKFNEWNPWMDLDPQVKVTYHRERGKIGDRYCWKGNKDAGVGCHEITALVPNRSQKNTMFFEEPFQSKATSDIILVPISSNETKITWTMDCDLEYPMNLMKLFMDKEMDKSYTKGLNKLKELVETGN